MASDHGQSDRKRGAAERRSLQPPPKPNRTRPTPAVADEDQTIRLSLGETAGAGPLVQSPQPPLQTERAQGPDPVASSSAPVHLPVPPPLPSASRPSNQTPSV